MKAAAQERLDALIDPDRALRTAAALAYSDVTGFYDEQFRLKPMKDWPQAARQCIKRIERRLANVDPGDGAIDEVLRLELYDKIKPLEMLFDHMGLREEKVKVSGNITLGWKE